MLWEEIKFDKEGLIPAIIQDNNTLEVLMVAYMNEEALKLSLETGKTHFWSRSRQKIWMKGETSGYVQEIVDISLDCDGDAILIKVKQTKAACHTGHKSCFYRQIDKKDLTFQETSNKVFDPSEVYKSKDKASILQKVYDVIVDRQKNPKEGSYTNYLFEKGIDKILKKVGEESAEVIIAAKNRVKKEVIYEVADLLYHLMVTLVEQDIKLEEIYDELERRR